MAWGYSCADCRYCTYSPSYDTHIGKNGELDRSKGESDWYCERYGKWLHTTSGYCNQFEEK